MVVRGGGEELEREMGGRRGERGELGEGEERVEGRRERER